MWAAALTADCQLCGQRLCHCRTKDWILKQLKVACRERACYLFSINTEQGLALHTGLGLTLTLTLADGSLVCLGVVCGLGLGLGPVVWTPIMGHLGGRFCHAV